TTHGKQIAFSLTGEGFGRSALDLGCGDAFWSDRLRDKGFEVVEADIAPKRVRTLWLDATRPLPFPDGSFDLVWCTEVIEHLGDPSSTCAELLRVVRRAGTLLL